MIPFSSLKFRSACPAKVRALRAWDPNLSPVVAEMLVARGHTTPEEVRRFFHPTPDALHSPFLLRGMSEAVEVLRTSLSEGRRVLIHGDYDCDGVCGTTLLMEALQEIGAEVEYHIPDRFEEGYGLSSQAVDRCLEERFGLLLTVDCGSSSAAQIERARAAGIRTIITDHHAVPPELPQPDAFVNPQQPGCSYPFKGLCGTAVAYKLIQAFHGRGGADPRHLLDLVALATVADVVPLLDENRVLVQLGLQELRDSRREGLAALLEVAGRPGHEEVDAFAMGFTLGPRLNAAGRLEHARAGVELLLSRSKTDSRRLAAHLDQLNEARKECEKAISAEIELRLETEPHRWQRGVIVEWGEGWHEGVIGITAGRLAEKYGVPALVVATGGQAAKGSARSPENVDLYQALKRCGGLFSKFGGHPRAAGFSLPSARLPELVEAMTEAVAALRTGPAPVWIDGCLSLGQADLALVKELERMEPFGEANPKPAFLLEGLDIVNRRLVGRNRDHLQLEVEQIGLRRRAIGFRQAVLVDKLSPQEFRYDLRCELGRDMFQGQEQLKVQITGIVDPPCREPEGGGSVLDLRHVRTRKTSLLHFLKEEGEIRVICREPEKARSHHPDFAARFFSYGSCREPSEALLLLSPPDSMAVFDACLSAARPSRLIILFGCQEVERMLHRLRATLWGRNRAVALWQQLRGLPSSFHADQVVALGKQQMALSREQTLEILSAFVETGAVRERGALLEMGQATGMRLEQTCSYRRQGKRLEELRTVRGFFSGPGLRDRLLDRFPCLAKAASQDSELKRQILV